MVYPEILAILPSEEIHQDCIINAVRVSGLICLAVYLARQAIGKHYQSLISRCQYGGKLLHPSSSLDTSSVSSDEEESILMAISTLFQENNNSNTSTDSLEYCSEDESTNRITARILTHSFVNYDEQKPCNHRCDVDFLKKILKETGRDQIPSFSGKHAITTSNSDIENIADKERTIVIVEVDATIRSARDSSRRYRLQLNMHRDADELAMKTLRRLSISLSRKVRQEERNIDLEEEFYNRRVSGSEKSYYHNLRQKKAKQDHSASISIMTLSPRSDMVPEDEQVMDEVDDNQLDGYSHFSVPDDMIIEDLWKYLSKFDKSKFCIDIQSGMDDYVFPEVCLPVQCCPPTILTVKTFENFESYVYIDIPLVVDVTVLHADYAVVTWFADEQLVCFDSPAYTPRQEDLGKKMSVLITPFRNGFSGETASEAYSFANKVEQLPEMPLISPFRDDWLLNRDTSSAGNNLRIMTYNLLADIYTSRDIDQQIMYNHCPCEFLIRKRRMPMLVREMLAFKNDIICLQEVDAGIFNSLYKPVLQSQGYQGFYSNKSSAQLEGCALFWSTEIFHQDPVVHTYFLKDLFKDNDHHHYERWESLGDIENLLTKNQELNEIATKKVGQVLQIAELRLRNPTESMPSRILVCNTHLFYHPMADHIRTMQAYLICRQLEKERAKDTDPCPLIICGDLNSGPLSGAVELFLQGRVGPENHDSWKHLHDYVWNMGDEDFLLEHGFIGNEEHSDGPRYEDEEFQDALESHEDEDDAPQIRLPPTFPRLVSAYPNVPEFTNFAVDFSETLDYILVSAPTACDPYGFVPLRAAPLPSRNDMEKCGAMPNENMPSDHFSLICDVDFKRYGKEND